MAEGLYMITLPMLPFRLRYVNIFAALEREGITLIDTGPNMPGVLPALEASLAEIGRQVEDCRRILITHFHADHCGLAGLIAGRSGAEIFLSEIDALTLRTFEDQELRSECRRRFGRENGLDAETLAAIEAAVSPFRTDTAPFNATGSLSGGDRLTVGGRSLEVVSTPGHSRGHLSFYLSQERFLIAGDHVLPRITPNLSPDLIDPSFRPLACFLGSLERVASLFVEMVCPAHGHPFPDLKGRVAEIREHHRERKGLALAAVAGEKPRTAAEVSVTIFGPDLPPFDRYLAVSESYVHLIELAIEGSIRQEKTAGLNCFRRV